MSLQGKKQLQARLRAIKLAFKPVGRSWGDEAVKQMRTRVPVRTGRLKGSFRVKNNTQRKTTVAGHYTGYFVDKGPKAHDIRPKRAKTLKFESGRNTIFTRAVHHRGYKGRPFRQRAAEEALRRTPAAQEVIRAWNRAA